MNPLTHLLVAWSVAEAADLPRRDRALVALAGVAPDLDGAGLLLDLARGTPPPLGAWGTYHHVLLHNLPAAGVCAALAFAAARRRALCAALVLASFHLHLLGDLVGSAGPGRSLWTLSYLYPFSQRTFVWQGQWELNAWPNLLLSALLLVWVGVLALRRGRTPLELLSRRADASLVGALRARFASS